MSKKKKAENKKEPRKALLCVPPLMSHGDGFNKDADFENPVGSPTWPVFSIPQQVILAHNKLAKENKGSLVCNNFKKYLSDWSFICKSQNEGVNKQKQNAFSQADIKELIQAQLNAFCSRSMIITTQIIKLLQQDKEQAERSAVGGSANITHFLPVFRMVVNVCNVQPVDVDKMTLEQKIQARMMPAPIQNLLGIDSKKLLSPAMKHKVELSNDYMLILHEIQAYLIRLESYRYDGALPDAPYPTIDVGASNRAEDDYTFIG